VKSVKEQVLSKRLIVIPPTVRPQNYDTGLW